MRFLSKALLTLSIVVVWSCGQRSKENGRSTDEVQGNQALYDEVMKVHNEVMPKLDDIHKLKEKLNDKIAVTPDMPEEKKKEIEEILMELDEADRGMWVWMRKFEPIPDSEGEDKAREYLENEMENVKKVKKDILQAIEKAEAVL